LCRFSCVESSLL